MITSGMVSLNSTLNIRSHKRTTLSAQWNLNRKTTMMAVRKVTVKALTRLTKKIKNNGKLNQVDRVLSIKKAPLTLS